MSNEEEEIFRRLGKMVIEGKLKLPSPDFIPDSMKSELEGIVYHIGKFMNEFIITEIPICEKHKKRMSPVRWMIEDGITQGTEYLCELCRDESLENNRLIELKSGPIIPF